MTKAKYKLKPEHEARFQEWRDFWIANAMSCEPMTEADRSTVAVAVRGIYAAAGKAAPRVCFVSSPMTAAIATGVAAGVWYLREHPENHRELFGRSVSDREVMAAIAPACRRATASGMRMLSGEPVPAVPVPVRAATDDATRAATYAATDDATSAATYAATDAATRDATRAATYAATDAATYAATRDATDAATYAATRAATYAATYDATRDATYAATDAATYAATRDATYDATRDATYAATDAATDAATRDATSDATSDATDAATRAATDAATDDATRDATYAATDDATYENCDDLVVAFLIRCSGYSWRLYQGGNMWSAWSAYLTFFRYVAQLSIDYAAWDHWEVCSLRSGFRYVHERFCIVSDRPEVLRKDEQNRPHCESGPSHRWRDGWELYHWRGTRVPAAWIRDKAGVDPSLALTWDNIEQRRCLAEIVGWGRVLERLKPTVVDQDEDPEIGTLLRADLPGSPGEQFLRVQCGTGRQFVLPVPPEMTSALQANAWTYGVDAKTLKQLEGRT